MGLGKVQVLIRLKYAYSCANFYSAVKIRGAECGIEAIILGVITSIGGFLFGYDTVCTIHALFPIVQRLIQDRVKFLECSSLRISFSDSDRTRAMARRLSTPRFNPCSFPSCPSVPSSAHLLVPT